jgi:hypothetical protein
MKRDEVFPSKYLKAADLNGKSICVTIEKAPLEVLKNPEGKQEAKTVLHFVKGTKMLPLNRVNWDSVAEICGDDTDTEEWPGKKIELFPWTTEMKGKPTPCIRVRAPEQRELPTSNPKKATKKPAAQSSADEMDDEIPF